MWLHLQWCNQQPSPQRQPSDDDHDDDGDIDDDDNNINNNNDNDDSDDDDNDDNDDYENLCEHELDDCPASIFQNLRNLDDYDLWQIGPQQYKKIRQFRVFVSSPLFHNQPW